MYNKNVIPKSKASQNHKYKSIFTGLTFKGGAFSRQEYALKNSTIDIVAERR
ncbi:hypothetical protein [Lentilactobacillus hilgardii]|uniref:hypothetical protein n=1 Tax=Lentilactobacillus hilgardii TaxID=1588 RepID=UPI00019C5584|nr:hypothetical protein [Lentilactobacillus hilgardii]EEI19749.1 hypothetical protein HMPREF0497_1455 [Lentilactobacillus buchneri ATCC 11577]